MPFHSSSTYHDIVNSFGMTEEHKSKLTKDTPYIMLMDELWTVYCENWVKLIASQQHGTLLWNKWYYLILFLAPSYTIQLLFQIENDALSSNALQWRHYGCNGISNHQPHDCLLNLLFRCKSNKTPKLHVTGLCAGNSLVTWTKLSIWP